MNKIKAAIIITIILFHLQLLKHHMANLYQFNGLMNYLMKMESNWIKENAKKISTNLDKKAAKKKLKQKRDWKIIRLEQKIKNAKNWLHKELLDKKKQC